MACYSHPFKNFPPLVVIHTVKIVGIVNKSDVFLELSCFFDDPTDVGNLISDSSAFSKSSLNNWKFMVETVTDFILGGSKITADGDYSHEIKRRLLFGRKARTNLDSILKSRDITLPTKVCLVKAMVFPVVMYGCENWTIKKAECRELMLLNCGVGEDS